MQTFQIRWWLYLSVAAALLAYAAFFLSLSNPPFTDGPNHLARAAIMKSLWFDPHSPFQGMFSVRRFFMPYMLPDLGLVVLLRTIGLGHAYPVWSALSMLSLALGVSVYAWQVLETSWGVAAAVLCSLYFGTNYLFILGFFSFQWGLAAAFFALGALEAWRRNKGPWWIALYAGACLACYGAHMACFAILAGMVGATGLVRVYRREQTPVRLAWELLPFAVLAAYHLPKVPTYPGTASRTIGTVIHDKFGHLLQATFVRQSFVDRPMLVPFGVLVIAAIWFGMRRHVDLRPHWQLALISSLGAGLYFALPSGLGSVAYVDQRALPFLFIPVMMLALRIFESAGPSDRQIMLLIAGCAFLAAVNLGSLARFLPRQSRQVAEYRRAIATIPERRVVLSVDAQPRDGNTWPMRHAGSFYAADRNGYTPYLFSQQNASGPAEYFFDLSDIYRPGQDWYTREGNPDWKRVAATYDFVIVSKPWRAGLIDRSDLELYFENSAATVFRVRRP